MSGKETNIPTPTPEQLEKLHKSMKQAREKCSFLPKEDWHEAADPKYNGTSQPL